MLSPVRSLLRASDLSAAEIAAIFGVAAQLKVERAAGLRRDSLRGKHVALYFEKPSVRTRVSFTVGVRELGGDVVELAPGQTRVGGSEHPFDFARVMGRYCHALVARVFSDEALESMAAGFLPVVNALSDRHHPCQALADYFTLHERFGSLAGLRLAFVGDGRNNVAHSLLEMGRTLGVEVRVACPAGYEPERSVMGTRAVLRDPAVAAAGAHALYTDTWVSMGREAERAERERALGPYRLTRSLLRVAEKGAVVMHCLPAVRGEEIDADLLHDLRSVVFDQAENRLPTQQALLLSLLGL